MTLAEGRKVNSNLDVEIRPIVKYNAFIQDKSNWTNYTMIGFSGVAHCSQCIGNRQMLHESSRDRMEGIKARPCNQGKVLERRNGAG